MRPVRPKAPPDAKAWLEYTQSLEELVSAQSKRITRLESDLLKRRPDHAAVVKDRDELAKANRELHRLLTLEERRCGKMRGAMNDARSALRGVEDE
jgi:hypothetical protein